MILQTRMLALGLALGFGAWLVAAPVPVLVDEDVGEPASASGISPAPPGRSPRTTRYDHGDPTVHEQLMMELVNRARMDPGAEAARLGIDLNDGLPAGTIQDTPKQALAFHGALIAAARAHSQWMLDHDVFSHTGVDGTDGGDRMLDAGYVFAGSWSWGENLSWGGTTGTPDVTAYTIARHESLFRSSGHRKNLCNGTFDELGVGILQGVFTTTRDYNAVMVTQNYARSAATPGPLLLGVVFADADGDGFYDPGEGVPGVTVQPENGLYHALTSFSGGYALPPPAGTGPLTVEFSGTALPVAVSRVIQRNGENIKLDLDLTNLGAVRVVADSLSYSPALGFGFVVSGKRETQFTVFHSADMINWVPLQQHTMGDEPLTIRHNPQPPSPAHFYRLAWQP